MIIRVTFALNNVKRIKKKKKERKKENTDINELMTDSPAESGVYPGSSI